MPIATSPLRYPGGKAPLLGLVSRIIRLNKLQYGHYAEPYAGGCGLALGLLYGGYVSDIHINDIDRGIWAFWHTVLNRTDEFIDLMNRTPITLDEWRRRREMQRNQRGLSQLEIAFTTFFLNRHTIGRETCRENVCQSDVIYGAAITIKKKKQSP